MRFNSLLSKARRGGGGKRISKRIWVILAGLAFCSVIIPGSGLLSVEHDPRFSIQKARVITTDDTRLSPDPYVENLLLGRQSLEIELMTGAFSGQRVQTVNTLSRVFNHLAKPGMVMLFNVQSEGGTLERVDLFGYNRDGFIYALVGLFLLVLVAVGRKKGFYSALSLVFTLTVIVYFMIPLILKGQNPILMAVVTSALTTVFTILLVGDFTLKSVAAITGVVLGVASSGAVGVIAGKFGHVSGLIMTNAEEVLYLAVDLPLKVPELLFCGIIIASLGAIMDVGMSISSAVFEVASVNPKLGMRALYRSGMNIGRDIMGTMSNTLILAFAGSSISVLLIIVLYQLPYIRLINLDLLAVELVQGIAGSIGLVLTIPITAFCAAAVQGKHRKKARR